MDSGSFRTSSSATSSVTRPAADLSSDNARELELLIRSRYPIICIETVEEDRAEKLLRIVAGRMLKAFVFWRVDEGLFMADDTIPIPDTKTPSGALLQIALSRANAVYLLADLQRYLDDAATVRHLKEAASAAAKQGSALVLMGPEFQLSEDLKPLAANFKLRLPDQALLKQAVLSAVSDLQSRGVQPMIRLDEAGWQQVLNALTGLTVGEAQRAMTRVLLKHQALGQDGLNDLLQIRKDLWMRDGVLESYGASELLASIGGMPNLKSWLAKRKGAFTPEAKAFGLTPPKGVLLIGIPGCGKSMAAKAVAHEWGMPLLRLDPSRLYDRFIGGSEKNLQKALETANAMAPCVLFIDEFEKGFSYSQSSESDAGLSRRLFGSFLTWMQDRPAPVFLFATSNDISVLPPELLRKGRFDEIFFVDLPSPEVRLEIWTIHLRKRGRDPARFDLPALTEASNGFSGAEIEQVLVNALYSAFSARQDLSTEDLMEEVLRTVPLSVTMKERVDALREWAKTRAVFV